MKLLHHSYSTNGTPCSPLLGRLPVEGLSEGEPLCAEAHGAVSQQEEPAVLPAEVRRHLLR